MKPLVIVTLCYLVVACSKDKSSPNTIIGEWKQTDVYDNAVLQQPWIPVNDGITLKINADSSYTTSGNESPLFAAGAIKTLDGKTLNIQPYISSSSFHAFTFSVTDNSVLELNYPCIELCGLRFKRVR